MDALSDVLSMLRVGAVLSSRFDGQGAWAFRFPAYRHIKFGGVLSGRFCLWLEGSDTPLQLERGDFYMLTTGEPFCSASDPAREPMDGPAIYRAIRSDDGVVRYTGETDPRCAHVSLASGRFTFENDVTELLLRHLPPVMHLRANDAAPDALRLLLDLLRNETGTLQPGAHVARSSLAALVLVHALRTYLASTEAPQGWLGALSDPKVGRALGLMHEHPEQRWTVEGLAQAVGMSRTAFANHFRRRVDTTPLEYLSRWRMAMARTALRDSDESLASIAERTGYQSDTAFSLAFKRSIGQSPGRFRTQSRSAFVG